MMMSLRRFLTAALVASAALAGAAPAMAAGDTKHPRAVNGSWEGPLGRFDRAQLQRGFQIYKEVCSSCHSMNLMHYRNLGERGGPFWDPKYPNANDNPVVRAIAAQYTVQDMDAEGEEIERPGRPSDPFIRPFESDAIAKQANGGALPPDLSVITKARHGGADYIYSLLTGYNQTPPAEKKVPDGKYYNPYMPGGVIAMSEQIPDGRVEYANTEANKGVTNTEEQMSKDVAAFLQWAGDPKQTIRKQTGVAVMAFLAIFAILLWFTYRSVWRNVEH
jgi:ubiquinol-cytochrome c reductase cytochrome c1 subunit